MRIHLMITLGDTIVPLLKLGLTGAIIAAIAFAFVVFDNPRGDIQEAEADLWDVFVRNHTKHERFLRTLEREGMSAPRQYDYNGNQVYFSYQTTRESPQEVLLRYQEALNREGVNDAFFRGAPTEGQDPREIENPEDVILGVHGMEAFFSGSLVPAYTVHNSMAMVGVETKGGAENFLDVLVESRGGSVAPEDLISSFRYIDAFRQDGSLETHVTAVWTDEDFDLRKHRLGDRYGSGTVHPIELEIPVCIGCERVARLSGTGAEANLHSFLWRTRLPDFEVLSFYDRYMGEYGWEPEPPMRGMTSLMDRGYAPYETATVRSYNRGPLNLTLIVYFDYEDGFTYVKALTTQ